MHAAVQGLSQEAKSEASRPQELITSTPRHNSHGVEVNTLVVLRFKELKTPPCDAIPPLFIFEYLPAIQFF